MNKLRKPYGFSIGLVYYNAIDEPFVRFNAVRNLTLWCNDLFQHITF